MNKAVEKDETQNAVAHHKTIAAALAAAQAEMGRAQKSANNPHFKTKYADLDSVCDAAMPALNRHGIAVIQPLQKDGDDWLVLTRFVHGETGELMETPIPLLLGKRDMQGLGSAITYARRYGLMTLAGIAPEDDDGNAAVASGPQREAPRPPQGPSREAIENAANAVANADTIDRLRAIWADLPKPIQSAREVIEAKDRRKGELERISEGAGRVLDELEGDHIPY